MLTISLLSRLARELYYLDPGSGSVLIQLLVAGLLAAGVLLRSYWGKIKTIFGKKDAPKDDADDE
jgi:hypothetical protein